MKGGSIMLNVSKHIPIDKKVYSAKTLEALAEANRISSDNTIPSYTNIEDLRKALEA